MQHKDRFDLEHSDKLIITGNPIPVFENPHIKSQKGEVNFKNILRTEIEYSKIKMDLLFSKDNFFDNFLKIKYIRMAVVIISEGDIAISDEDDPALSNFYNFCLWDNVIKSNSEKVIFWFLPNVRYGNTNKNYTKSFLKILNLYTDRCRYIPNFTTIDAGRYYNTEKFERKFFMPEDKTVDKDALIRFLSVRMCRAIVPILSRRKVKSLNSIEFSLDRIFTYSNTNEERKSILRQAGKLMQLLTKYEWDLDKSPSLYPFFRSTIGFFFKIRMLPNSRLFAFPANEDTDLLVDILLNCVIDQEELIVPVT